MTSENLKWVKEESVCKTLIKKSMNYMTTYKIWIICNSVHNLKQIEWKDQLIEAIRTTLIEKEEQIENMVNASFNTDELIQIMDVTCNTNHSMQMVDATCDTNDLIQLGDTNTTNVMINDSLIDHEKESIINKELMKTIFEDESHETQSYL